MYPLISVIVPIYKVEDYLKRAVDSVLAQTHQNLEVILVDDGSPDLCGSICDSYAKTDERVKVIHKQNGGLSDARNAGLDVATGEYISFLDSDDYWAPYFLEEMLKLCRKTDSEVAFCSYTVVESDDTSAFRRADRNTFVYNRQELLENMYDFNHEDATYFIVAWNKLYKAGLWEGVRFPKGKIHEDEATTYQIFDKAKQGVYVKAPMYGYFSAPASITRAAFQLKRLDWMDALTGRMQYFLEKKEETLFAYALRARADGAIRYYYALQSAMDELVEKEQIVLYRDAAVRLKRYVRDALRGKRMYGLSHGKLVRASTMGYVLFLISPWLYGKVTRIS